MHVFESLFYHGATLISQVPIIPIFNSNFQTLCFIIPTSVPDGLLPTKWSLVQVTRRALTGLFHFCFWEFIVWFGLVCVWILNTWSKCHWNISNLQWMLTIVLAIKAPVLGLSFLVWNLAVVQEQLQHIEDDNVQIMHTTVYSKYIMFKKFQAAMFMMVVAEILLHAKTDGVANEYWI